MEASVAREIEAAVGEALALHGASGQVVVQGRQAELHGHGSPVVIDIEHLGEQWALLPQDLRSRKAGDVARRLVQASRAVSSLSPPPMQGGPARPPRLVAIPLGVVVLVGVGLFFGVRHYRSQEAPPPAPTTPVESVEEASARRARVCEAARKRIYAGASMGPFDLEGWVAELWLATAKPAGEGAPTAEGAGLGALLAEGKLTPAADVELAAVQDGVAEVVPGFDGDEVARSAGWRAVVVRFSGGYATAYFDGPQRARFVALADRMAVAAGADLGALYARCAHLRHRDAGAWFRGADPGSAAAALVYGAGFFAELPAVNQGAVTALGGAGPLDALRAAGSKLDAAALAKLVGAQGGSVTAGGSGGTLLTFPVGGPTRATGASRVVARKLGVGVD